MRVYGYHIKPNTHARPLEVTLAAIYGDVHRLQTHFTDFSTRFESFTRSNKKNLVAFDATKPLTYDIGKAKNGAPSLLIPLGIDESFTNFTAGLYSISKQTLLLQHNISGVRTGLLNEYFDAFSGHQFGHYEFSIIERDPDSASEIKSTDIRQIHFSARLARLHRAGMLNSTAIGKMLGWQKAKFGIDTATITLSCRVKKGNKKKGIPPVTGISDEEVAEFVDYAKIVSKVDPKALKMRFIAAKNEDITDDIMALAGKKWVYEEALPSAGNGILQPFKDRLNILERALVELPI